MVAVCLDSIAPIHFFAMSWRNHTLWHVLTLFRQLFAEINISIGSWLVYLMPQIMTLVRVSLKAFSCWAAFIPGLVNPGELLFGPCLETKQTKHEKKWCQFMASLCPGDRLKTLSQQPKFDAIIPLPKIYTPSFSKQTFHISLLVVKTKAFLQPWTCSMSSRTRMVPQVPDDWRRRRPIFFGSPFSRLWDMRWKVWRHLDKFFGVESWNLDSFRNCIVNLSLWQVMFLKNFVSRLEGSVC